MANFTIAAALSQAIYRMPAKLPDGFDNSQLVDYNIIVKYLKRRFDMANQVGKRYRCGKCGSEFIVTKGGAGTITCCGQPMEQKK